MFSLFMVSLLMVENWQKSKPSKQIKTGKHIQKKKKGTEQTKRSGYEEWWGKGRKEFLDVK